MKDVFVCYAREEEEEKRKYIAVEAAWPPRSCCFLCNVLYKFYGIVIIKQTPYAGLFPSICYLSWLPPGVKAILTNFTSSAAVYIWSFFPILLTVVE